MNTCVCVLLSPTPRYFALQSIKDKTTVTHNNFRYCRVHFYAFLRQPFSKQLYTFAQYDNPLVRSSVSQISIYIKNMPQDQKGGGASVFEPLVRGGSCNF